MVVGFTKDDEGVTPWFRGGQLWGGKRFGTRWKKIMLCMSEHLLHAFHHLIVALRLFGEFSLEHVFVTHLLARVNSVGG